MDKLDVACRDRFSEWFSLHLSNFAFVWPWMNWSDVLPATHASKQGNSNDKENDHDNDDTHKKEKSTDGMDVDKIDADQESDRRERRTRQKVQARREFISDVMRQITDLSYHSRIRKTLPVEFECLFPKEALPHFRYDKINSRNDDGDNDDSNDNDSDDNNDNNGSSGDDPAEQEKKETKKKTEMLKLESDFAFELLSRVKEQAPATTLLGWMDEQATSATYSPIFPSSSTSSSAASDDQDNDSDDSGSVDVDLFKLRVFLPCLLEAGHKSYTHISVFLNKYEDVLQKLTRNDKQNRARADNKSMCADVQVCESERIIAASIAEYWRLSPMRVRVLMDLFHREGVLSAAAIVQFVFHQCSNAHSMKGGADGDADGSDSTLTADCPVLWSLLTDAIHTCIRKARESRNSSSSKISSGDDDGEEGGMENGGDAVYRANVLPVFTQVLNSFFTSLHSSTQKNKTVENKDDNGCDRREILTSRFVSFGRQFAPEFRKYTPQLREVFHGDSGHASASASVSASFLLSVFDRFQHI